MCYDGLWLKRWLVHTTAAGGACSMRCMAWPAYLSITDGVRRRLGDCTTTQQHTTVGLICTE